MFTLLRPEDNIKLVGTARISVLMHLITFSHVRRPKSTFYLFPRLQAVRLESIHAQITRYMVVVSTNGRQDTEESVVLGMDFSPRDG